MSFETKAASAAPDVIAPDGSEVRILCSAAAGGMALFSLAPGAVARAVVHRTVEELWYVVSGRGRMWRRHGDDEAVVELKAGVSLSIPVGTRFQFRCDGGERLVIVGATMPPWPGNDEAEFADGPWTATR